MSEKVEGLEEVFQLFTSAPKAVAGDALLNGLVAAGRVIEGAMVARTPVREIRIGGDAEYPALIEDLATKIVLGAGLSGGTVAVGFSKSAFVAHFLEWGHQMISHGPARKVLGHVEAKPFMRIAAAVSEEAAVDAFVDKFLGQMEAVGLVDPE